MLDFPLDFSVVLGAGFVLIVLALLLSLVINLLLALAFMFQGGRRQTPQAQRKDYTDRVPIPASSHIIDVTPTNIPPQQRYAPMAHRGSSTRPLAWTQTNAYHITRPVTNPAPRPVYDATRPTFIPLDDEALTRPLSAEPPYSVDQPLKQSDVTRPFSGKSPHQAHKPDKTDKPDTTRPTKKQTPPSGKDHTRPYSGQK